MFLIIREGIETYNDTRGHRVKLRVGNPHSIDFSDVSMTLGYGNSTFISLLHEVNVPNPPVIEAASWTNITVTINPSEAKDMRNIRIQLSLKTVKMK